jgi:EAL domain-containing protein (putative c-di-GMP-specific phosphodiesterase class I)
MTITAEGVETPEQLLWLEEQGCHQAQGYLIGRPSVVEGDRRTDDTAANLGP